jgi:hypothetical protein
LKIEIVEQGLSTSMIDSCIVEQALYVAARSMKLFSYIGSPKNVEVKLSSTMARINNVRINSTVACNVATPCHYESIGACVRKIKRSFGVNDEIVLHEPEQWRHSPVYGGGAGR